MENFTLIETGEDKYQLTSCASLEDYEVLHEFLRDKLGIYGKLTKTGFEGLPNRKNTRTFDYNWSTHRASGLPSKFELKYEGVTYLINRKRTLIHLSVTHAEKVLRVEELLKEEELLLIALRFSYELEEFKDSRTFSTLHRYLKREVFNLLVKCPVPDGLGLLDYYRFKYDGGQVHVGYINRDDFVITIVEDKDVK